MAITSVTINALQVGTGAYSVHMSSLGALKSGVPREAVMVERPGAYPIIIRSQVVARPLDLIVILTGGTLALRRTAYNVLVTACGTGYPLVPIAFTEDGVTYTWQAHCSGPVVDDWYRTAAIAAIAPNPEATVT